MGSSCLSLSLFTGSVWPAGLQPLVFISCQAADCKQIPYTTCLLIGDITVGFRYEYH